MIHRRKDRKNPGHADHDIRDSLNRCCQNAGITTRMIGTSNRASDHRMHYKDTNLLQWYNDIRSPFIVVCDGQSLLRDDIKNIPPDDGFFVLVDFITNNRLPQHRIVG